MSPLPIPFSSCSFLLVIVVWWTGGGSNVLCVALINDPDSGAFLGRERGETGLGGSSALLLLRGGVPNGEACSSGNGDKIAVVASDLAPSEMGLLEILGFSDLLTGGGRGLYVDSRRIISPDLRGGGGDGGCDGVSEGDLLGSSRGVCGLLGIRKCLGEEVPEVADMGVLSVER